MKDEQDIREVLDFLYEAWNRGVANEDGLVDTFAAGYLIGKINALDWVLQLAPGPGEEPGDRDDGAITDGEITTHHNMKTWEHWVTCDPRHDAPQIEKGYDDGYGD